MSKSRKVYRIMKQQIVGKSLSKYCCFMIVTLCGSYLAARFQIYAAAIYVNLGNVITNNIFALKNCRIFL
jgi:hypothetical protein